MPVTVLTDSIRKRNMEQAKERREQHRNFREQEGRPLPEPPADDVDELPSFTEDDADAAASSTKPKRTPVVLTPAPRAAAGRQNSFPQIDKLRNRVPKAKRDERRAADDPLYSVSLGTESDDESGRPDPTWWMRSPRGQRKRETDAPSLRSTTISQGRGRSPPPGFSWKDLKLPKGRPVPKRSRVASTASRNKSADKRKQPEGKRAA